MKPTANTIAAPKRRPATAFDVDRIRADFPILSTQSHGKPLVYLDNGATTQKPRAVIDRIVRFYERENANIHRGVYELSQKATAAYDETRNKVAQFINAANVNEVIFVRGTTEGVNLVASSWGRTNVGKGDEIIVSIEEHHSDIVPWQMLVESVGAHLRVIPMNDAGELLLDEYEKLLSPRTKIVAVTHVSNAMGTVNDVKQIAAMAHKVGAKVLVDGAQWVAHFPTDVQDIDCDFFVFSGHKLFGPTGVGVLYGKRVLLEAMPPYMGGGDMIENVTIEKTTYAGLPNKFEAGTPDIAGVVGLGAAIDYRQSIDFDSSMAYEHELLEYATRRLSEVRGLRIIGTAKHKAGVISFVMEDPPISSLDLGMQLDREGICVRTGHHCCQPLMDRLGIGSTTRASFTFYNTKREVDVLVDALTKIRDKTAPAAKVDPAMEIQFPKAAGASPEEIANELADLFDFLGENEARTQQLLDFAKNLPPYFAKLQKLTERLAGCMSQVYLITRPAPDDSTRLEFVADSDAHIVRGEIAMLQKLFSGQKASDIAKFDVENFLKRIGLEKFLSVQRRSGLDSMIKRIRTAAEMIAGGAK